MPPKTWNTLLVLALVTLTAACSGDQDRPARQGPKAPPDRRARPVPQGRRVPRDLRASRALPVRPESLRADRP